MAKAGLLVGGVMFLVAMGGGIVSPICVPCASLLPGIAAGYLAGGFARYATSSEAVKGGAGAGALGGVGALLGQMAASILNALMVKPGDVMDTFRKLGISVPVQGAKAFYVGQIAVGGCCMGLLDLGLMAAAGAAGGAIWFKSKGGGPPEPPA